MAKILIFARRKAGMCFDDFKDRYENGHVKLVAEMETRGLVPKMADYRRNYINQPDSSDPMGVAFDCVTSITYPTQAEMDALFAALQDLESEVGRRNAADIAEWLDVNSTRTVIVEEVVGSG